MREYWLKHHIPPMWPWITVHRSWLYVFKNCIEILSSYQPHLRRKVRNWIHLKTCGILSQELPWPLATDTRNSEGQKYPSPFVHFNQKEYSVQFNEYHVFFLGFELNYHSSIGSPKQSGVTFRFSHNLSFTKEVALKAVLLFEHHDIYCQPCLPMSLTTGGRRVDSGRWVWNWWCRSPL